MDRPSLTKFATLALATAALTLGTGARVHAQVPQPHVANPDLRSGLLYRHTSIQSSLPHDDDRDDWYDTRWNPPNYKHPNLVNDGGLYGMRWKGNCTSCNAPNFRGSPGTSTLCQNCIPKSKASRWTRQLFHPNAPVGMYYAGGCYVPIYDLDRFVPGPGPFPFPYYYNGNRGG
jgi:hypothetical protein